MVNIIILININVIFDKYVVKLERVDYKIWKNDYKCW